MAEAADVRRWVDLAAMLPCGQSAAETTSRKRMFGSFDSNGNGLLSFTEVERTISKVFGKKDAEELHAEIKGAFDYAKGAHIDTKSDVANAMVDKQEFRVLIAHLKRYFLLMMFKGLSSVSKDGKLDAKEFSRCVQPLSTWGVSVDPAGEFKAIDDKKPFEYRGTGKRASIPPAQSPFSLSL